MYKTSCLAEFILTVFQFSELFTVILSSAVCRLKYCLIWLLNLKTSSISILCILKTIMTMFQDIFYSRKNFMKPEEQHSVHRYFGDEVETLDKLFKSKLWKANRAICKSLTLLLTRSSFTGHIKLIYAQSLFVEKS